MRLHCRSDVPMQVDFIVAFLGVTYARAVAAPLNPNYKLVRLHAILMCLRPRKQEVSAAAVPA